MGNVIGKALWSAVLVVMLLLWVGEFYGAQPLVPKAKSVDPSAPNEYIVWLQGVNTAYQEDMLTWAQTRVPADQRFAMDIVTARQFLRYFGFEAGYNRRLYQPLFNLQPIDPTDMNYLLLHWPGVSGPVAEQVELRSRTKLTKLRDTPGWDLVYDNGESWVVKTQ